MRRGLARPSCFRITRFTVVEISKGPRATIQPPLWQAAQHLPFMFAPQTDASARGGVICARVKYHVVMDRGIVL